VSSRDLALVAVFAALIAALGLAGVIYPFGSVVPITAQTLGVMLAGSILGARRGVLAVLTFLVLVAAGLPWLAGGRGGLGVFAGPTAGFLIGWLPGAAVIGALAARRSARGQVGWLILANLLGGIAVVYACGVPVLALRTHVSLWAALTGTAVYLPGDVIKVAVAGVVTAAVVRGYPGVVRER
jgi:biotin transport system substrate-specific component